MLKLLFTLIAFTHSLEPAPYTLLEPNSDCHTVISYNYYELCYSSEHRQAFWTFHLLTKESVLGTQARINDYKEDLTLNDPVMPWDFRGSGFDRGHLVPAGDMKLNWQSMTDTFFMTNMSPQRSSFNSGIWRSLESHIRSQVLKLGEALVVTAPVLLKNVDYVKIRSGISVPLFYYKIAYYPEASHMEAYLIPNESQKGISLENFLISVDEVEALTGYDFFERLEDTIEDELEALNSLTVIQL